PGSGACSDHPLTPALASAERRRRSVLRLPRDRIFPIVSERDVGTSTKRPRDSVLRRLACITCLRGHQSTAIAIHVRSPLTVLPVGRPAHSAATDERHFVEQLDLFTPWNLHSKRHELLFAFLALAIPTVARTLSANNPNASFANVAAVAEALGMR